MGLNVSARIKAKLAQKTPPVTEEEIVQCFANRQGCYLLDTREQHRTEPPTKWFIAETDFGRKLKVVFIPEGSDVTIKTAYDPNDAETRIYNSNCRTE
jgi:hypothetical protein